MIFKIILCVVTFLTLALQVSVQFIQFNGLYETECNFEFDDEGEQDYLRFYPNGKVISVSTECEGEASDLKEWFTIDNKKGSIGEYQIKNQKIKFTTTSGSGSVVYKGKLTKTGSLILKSKSLINGFKDKVEYHFIELPE